MAIKRKIAKLAPFLQSAVVVLISLLFVSSIVYAATTISANIATDGNLDVNGTASTTSATSTYYIYIGQDITEPPGWDFGMGDLLATDDVYIGGQATTSVSLSVGDPSVPALFNFAGGDLAVQDDLFAGGNATTSGNLSIGGFASTTGYLKVGGGVFDLATSTGATTTPGIFSRDRTSSTSTISIGNIDDGSTKTTVGCLEMAATDGTYFRCYINVAGAAGAALECVTGRCN